MKYGHPTPLFVNKRLSEFSFSASICWMWWRTVNVRQPLQYEEKLSEEISTNCRFELSINLSVHLQNDITGAIISGNEHGHKTTQCNAPKPQRLGHGKTAHSSQTARSRGSKHRGQSSRFFTSFGKRPIVRTCSPANQGHLHKAFCRTDRPDSGE